MLQTFCFQELHDGTGMDKAPSEFKIIEDKGRPFSVFCWWICTSFNFTAVVAVIFETSRSNLMMAAILNLLMLSDQEDGYLKNVHSLVDGQTVKKI